MRALWPLVIVLVLLLPLALSQQPERVEDRKYVRTHSFVDCGGYPTGSSPLREIGGSTIFVGRECVTFAPLEGWERRVHLQINDLGPGVHGGHVSWAWRAGTPAIPSSGFCDAVDLAVPENAVYFAVALWRYANIQHCENAPDQGIAGLVRATYRAT